MEQIKIFVIDTRVCDLSAIGTGTKITVCRIFCCAIAWFQVSWESVKISTFNRPGTITNALDDRNRRAVVRFSWFGGYG